MKAKRQFGLHTYPLPKNASGKTFFDKAPGYCKFKRSFAHLIEEPGLGVLYSDAGVGKTVAIRNECWQLPQPDYPII
ncbi:MAG: hypothetical protein ACOC1F_13590, partial [Myxococcota bacterium]